MKRAEKIFLPSSVGERHEARGRGADLGYWKVLTKIVAFFLNLMSSGCIQSFLIIKFQTAFFLKGMGMGGQ